MDRRGAAAFVAWGIGAELPAAALLAALAPALWPGRVAWAIAGWAAMTALGLAAGAWLTTLHGRASRTFVVALLSGMLARLVMALGGFGFALVGVGRGAAWAWIVGLAAGYVPLQLFETVWFIRRATPQAS